MDSNKDLAKDVESGSIDAGLVKDIVIEKTSDTLTKKRKAILDDPTSEINASGVGVMQIDE